MLLWVSKIVKVIYSIFDFGNVYSYQSFVHGTHSNSSATYDGSHIFAYSVFVKFRNKSTGKLIANDQKLVKNRFIGYWQKSRKTLRGQINIVR